MTGPADLELLENCNDLFYTTICNNNNFRHTAGMFFLPIVLEKKIDNTSTIDVDDNNFGLDLPCSNNHDCDNACELAFDTKHKTVDDNRRTTYQVHQPLFYSYGIDSDGDHDHKLLQCKDNECKNMIPFLWKQALCSNASLALYFIFSSILNLYSNIVSSNIILSLSFPQKQIQVQVQVQSHANPIHITPYCIYGVDTDLEYGCGMDDEVPILVRVLYCGMFQVEYNIRAYSIICDMIQLVYVPSVLLVPVIDPAFGITIVYPRSALYLVTIKGELFVLYTEGESVFFMLLSSTVLCLEGESSIL